MKEFEHINATSINETLSLIKEEPDTSIIAGGTDLLPRMKIRLTTPKRLVNIKTVPNINQISFDEVSGLRIGVLALLDDIEKNAIIQKNILFYLNVLVRSQFLRSEIWEQ
ncbi:TPA: hypothetical protein ENS27_06980 [bacterium]|nr:hypothetical protein [bacterium]